MAVIAVIDLKTRPGKRAQFLKVLRQSLKETVSDPACTRLDYLVDDSDPDRVVVVEGWTSREAHEAYSKRLMASGGMADLMPLMDGMPTTTHYSLMG